LEVVAASGLMVSSRVLELGCDPGKAAGALCPGGFLILLWNEDLQPSAAFHQRTAHLQAELAIPKTLAEVLIDPPLFSTPLSGLEDSPFIDSAERVLDLLARCSGYLQLDPGLRHLLSEDLRLLIHWSEPNPPRTQSAQNPIRMRL